MTRRTQKNKRLKQGKSPTIHHAQVRPGLKKGHGFGQITRRSLLVESKTPSRGESYQKKYFFRDPIVREVKKKTECLTEGGSKYMHNYM